MPFETWSRNGYKVSTDPALLDIDFIHRELDASAWARGIPRAVVEKSIANSLVFGLYRPDGGQIGVARLVTDRATFAYLCDVIVTPGERGRGLGKWLNECVVAHSELQGLRRWVLATKDAHGVYRRFGWTPLNNPETFMERFFPDVYKSKK